jgi:hypothetical protein
MNEEYAQLPVHGRHLGYARSQLAQMGIPSNVIGQDGNIYIIMIPATAAPMVQGAPWMYQRESWAHGLARFPWIRLMLIGGSLLAMLYFCQAAGIMAGLIGMTWNPEIQAAVEAQKSEQAAAENANALQQLIENLESTKTDLEAEVNRRVDDAKQEVHEAIMSTVIMAVGVPLLFALVAVAAWLILKMRKRS